MVRHLRAVAAPILDKQAEIVIPCRDEQAYQSTYPIEQVSLAALPFCMLPLYVARILLSQL